MPYEFYVTINGTKQGVFKGEGVKDKTKDKIVGLAFSYELKSPRDAATGQPSGKRQHSPAKIVKEWGAATPQIFQALVSNEALKEVKLEFYKVNANGEEYVYYTVRLTNASVSAIRQYTSDGGVQASSSAKQGSSSLDLKELEEVSFTFQKIEVESKDGKTMSMDDWKAN